MIWPDGFVNKVVNGEALEVLKKMPKESIDMCMTSPPYWGLRDYGVKQIFGGNINSHKCKHIFGKDDFCIACRSWKGQLGLEPTPEMYIKHLTEIFSEVKRVLKKEGTLWLNIGDTYSTHTSKRSGQFGKEIKDGFDDIYTRNRILPLKEKCLCMIPERLAWSLIQDGWILRNKIIWYKPNSMPSSVKDRFSNRYEFIYMFSKQQKYYFDLDAVREPHTYLKIEQRRKDFNDKIHYGGQKIKMRGKNRFDRKRSEDFNPLGKNPGDVFEITTQPFPEAHFAVFPEKLCEKPIKAGCPEEVCKKCGKARERIVERYDTGETQKMPDYWEADLGGHGSIHRKGRVKGEPGVPIMANKTIGWTSCDCDAGFEGGIVLDLFAGAGTTLYVAKQLRRRFIGIDIKPEYCEMSEKRLAQGVLNG